MPKKCMLFETLGSITEMKRQECSNANEIRLSGVFGVCGVKNNNRRTYSKENYGQMVESLQREIVESGVLGELEHPESMNINLNNVSHKIESVEMMEDGTVHGTILLLNTDKGKNAKAIVEAGVPLYISSRALGNIDSNGNVTLTSLKTYDLVGTPGFSQAKLNQLKESNQAFECLNESTVAIYLDEAEDDKKEEKEKKDDDNNTVTINVNDQAESENKKDKENNTDKDKPNDMETLIKKVDELTQKVESLEATLHVAKESLAAKDEIIAKLNESKGVNYQAIENWVTEEFGPRFKNSLINQISEGVEKYMSEKIIENNNKIEEWIDTEYAPTLEAWITKEYAPIVESWVTKEFAPIVEQWSTEELTALVEQWTVEHFGNKVNEWMEQEVKPSIMESVNENVSEFFEAKINEMQDTKFDNIDKMLESLENSGKPAETLLEEAQKANARYASFPAIQNMPNEYRPLWEMLSDARKDEIAVMSRAYDYTKQGVLESFWAGVDFNAKDVKKVVEHVEPQKNFANFIAESMRKMRK